MPNLWGVQVLPTLPMIRDGFSSSIQILLLEVEKYPAIFFPLNTLSLTHNSPNLITSKKEFLSSETAAAHPAASRRGIQGAAA